MKKILFFTDGSSEGTVKKPGPCGAGIVAVMDTETQERAVPLGHGTNQQAELLAVRAALEMVPAAMRAQVHAHVVTDSKYAIGCLTEGWNVIANAEIVRSLRSLAAQFGEFSMRWVPGHAGHGLNERAHQLAKAGRQRAREGQPAPPRVVEEVPPPHQVALEHDREVIAHLVSALQWYADPLTYLSPPGDDQGAPSIVRDRGEVARAVLEQFGFAAVAEPFEEAL